MQEPRVRRRERLIEAALTITADAPERTVCIAIGVSRSTLRRRRIGREEASLSAPRQPRNALSPAERAAVLDVLNSQRFADLAAPQVFAQLLDEGVYLCSLSTMYRLLRANDQVSARIEMPPGPRIKMPPPGCVDFGRRVWMT